MRPIDAPEAPPSRDPLPGVTARGLVLLVLLAAGAPAGCEDPAPAPDCGEEDTTPECLPPDFSLPPAGACTIAYEILTRRVFRSYRLI